MIGTVSGYIQPYSSLASVAALTEGVLKTMFLTKLKIAAAVLLTVSLVATGTGVLTYQSLADSEPKPVAVEVVVAYKADLSRLSEDAAKRYAAIKPRPAK